MFRVRRLGNFVESGSSRKDRRRLAAQERRPIRLMLESLEERLTPSGGNPTVTQTAGDYTALTAAVAADTAANTNYVIQITGNFTFNSGGQVTISKLGSSSTLTLSGQNGTNYTLTGNGNRLFTVASGQNVTFADLTLTGGSVANSKDNAQGGAILDQGGNVTLSKVAVEGNTVTGAISASGGGVSISGGSLTVVQSTIKNNLAQGSKGLPGLPAGSASGGGVSVEASTVVIRDSIISDNSARGYRGADGTTQGALYDGWDARNGGSALGGGLYVVGENSAWAVTLIGDTLSGNTVIGGDGGDGAVGNNAAGSNAQGSRGGNGGDGGDAQGGAAYFVFANSVHDPGPGGIVPPYASGQLTILNDPDSPTAYPSLMIDNSVQGGSGGKGAAGGISTGTANNANGGWGGRAGIASGGGVYLASSPIGGTFTAAIGNTTFFGNSVFGGNGGAAGAAGGGGSGAAGTPGNSGPSEPAAGGGVRLGLMDDSALTMVNSTVAKNTLTAGFNGDGTRGDAGGGGLDDFDHLDHATVILDNNTITQNTISGASGSSGTGVYLESFGNPTLVNNLIQGNRSLGSTGYEFDTGGTYLSNATNNFITSISPNAVSTSTNIVGNSQLQLGSVVGVDANGNPSGGPVYYPLLPGVVSIGAGSASVLSTIAAVEGTTAANAVDEIGNPLFRNGAIDLGALQNVATPPSAPVLSPFQLMVAITLDTDAFLLQEFPPALSFLNALSEQVLRLPLPATADLIPTIEGDFAALMDILVGTIAGDTAALVNFLRRDS